MHQPTGEKKNKPFIVRTECMQDEHALFNTMDPFCFTGLAKQSTFLIKFLLTLNRILFNNVLDEMLLSHLSPKISISGHL